VNTFQGLEGCFVSQTKGVRLNNNVSVIIYCFFNLIEVEVNVKLANLESGKKEEMKQKSKFRETVFF